MNAAPPTTSTTACNRVVKFVNYQVEKIKESLDGKNIEFVLYELGVRLHRVIYEHMQQFTYSSAGVMAVICDVQVLIIFNFHCIRKLTEKILDQKIR